MPPAGEPDAKEPSAQALPALPLPNPPGWAIVELFGHRRRAGWVEEVRIYGVEKARIHIPLPDGGERIEDYDGKAVYGQRWVDEATARHVAADIERFEVQPLGPPQLTAHVAMHDGIDDDEPSAGDDPQDEELAF